MRKIEGESIGGLNAFDVELIITLVPHLAEIFRATVEQVEADHLQPRAHRRDFGDKLLLHEKVVGSHDFKVDVGLHRWRYRAPFLIKGYRLVN